MEIKEQRNTIMFTSINATEDDPLSLFKTKINTFLDIVSNARRQRKPARINLKDEIKICRLLENLSDKNCSKREKKYNKIQESVRQQRQLETGNTPVSQKKPFSFFKPAFKPVDPSGNSLELLFSVLQRTKTDRENQIINEHMALALETWIENQLPSSDESKENDEANITYLSLSDLEENLLHLLRPYLLPTATTTVCITEVKHALESIHEHHWLDFIECIEAKKAEQADNSDDKESLIDNTGNKLLMDYLEMPDDDRPFMGF